MATKKTQVTTLDDFTPKVVAKKAKFENNTKYRVALPWLTDENKVRIEAVEFYSRYDGDEVPENKRIRITFRAKNDKAKELGEKYCGSPKVRYVTPILIYATNDEGQMTKNNIGNFTIKPWVFTDKALALLKTINEENGGLSNIDLGFVGTDNYSSVSILPKSDQYYSNEKYKDHYDLDFIKEEIERITTDNALLDVIATEMDEFKIKNILNLSDDDSLSESDDDLLDDDLPI